MSSHEIYAGLQFLYSTLTGDTTLMSLVTGVYRGMAPDKATPIFVVIGFQSGMDTLTVNAVRILTRPLYLVKAVGPASMSEQIAQAAARIDDLLKRTSGTTTGSKIDVCYREMPLMVDEPPVLGTIWTALGGLYRMAIEQV